MPSASRATFDLRPLHRPLWWAALALLLVNDNLLKGGGVVPGWLTGKLSDFAFLIVAPVLLAVLLPRALPRRREVTLGTVGLVYTAADLSPAVSDAIVAAAGRLGMSWQLWPDVTDLVALLVLPLAWRLLRPPVFAPSRPVAAGQRRWLEFSGVVAGALACLATSSETPPYQKAIVVNQTTQPRTVTATWLLRTLPCNGDLTAIAASLTSGDLDDPKSATLASGASAILDLMSPPSSDFGSCHSYESSAHRVSDASGGCLGVILEATGGPSVLASFPITWSEDNEIFYCRTQFSLDENPGPSALALRERNGQLVLTFDPESKMRLATVSRADIASRPAGPQSCTALLAEQDLLISSSSGCARDADCLKRPALPVPGDTCVIHGNGDLTPLATSDLRRRWNAGACIVDINFDRSCQPAQPVSCVSGRCQAVCPGVDLPVCPSACGTGAVTGARCYGGYTCAAVDGTWCRCNGDTFVCQPPPRAPGCPLTCVQRETPGAPPPAVAPDARPADAQPEAGGEEVR